MATGSKVIVSNRSALQGKYGNAGLKAIEAAIAKWIAADAKRGITSSIVWLDGTGLPPDAAPVTDPIDEAATKSAIDAIAGAHSDAAIVLLGAPDVVCHQHLTNPLWNGNPNRDPDRDVPSDLPYACTASHGKKIAKFLSPTRSVSRMPDVRGARDPKHLLRLIQIATGWKSGTADAYGAGFVLSADVWKGATRSSAKRLFGSSKVLLSPKLGPSWTAAQLQPRAHFINCHGAEVDPKFYGQLDDDFPVSHEAPRVKPITAGTVVVAECCYGAQLFAPQDGDPFGICHAYLENGAYAYVGSTTVAYGPFDPPNGNADLVCEYFLGEIQRGASTGDAMLAARKRFVNGQSSLDPFACKTLAQFLVLGDATCRPVKRSAAIPKSIRRGAVRAAIEVPMVAPAAKVIAERGGAPSSAVESAMRSLARKLTGSEAGYLETFDGARSGVRRGPASESKAIGGARIHCLWADELESGSPAKLRRAGAKSRPAGPRARVVIVAREEPGKEPVLQAMSSKGHRPAS